MGQTWLFLWTFFSPPSAAAEPQLVKQTWICPPVIVPKAQLKHYVPLRPFASLMSKYPACLWVRDSRFTCSVSFLWLGKPFLCDWRKWETINNRLLQENNNLDVREIMRTTIYRSSCFEVGFLPTNRISSTHFPGTCETTFQFFSWKPFLYVHWSQVSFSCAMDKRVRTKYTS